MAPDQPFIRPDLALTDLIGFEGIVLMLVASMGLMVPVAAVFAALSVGDIGRLVERLRWSWEGQADHLHRNLLRERVNFTGLIIAANVVAVVIVVLLLGVIGPLAFLLWFAVNGWLLGRDYFTLVAKRHLAAEELARLRAGNALKIWLAGTLMAVPLCLPLINLVVPFLGAAWFAGIFHRLWRG